MSYELYERIADEEWLRASDHVVLLDGLLVNQMSKGPRHRNAVYRGLAALQVALPPGWVVWNEQPIALRGGPAGDSAPEPDLAVVFGNLERYEDRHPDGAEVGLVVEISSSVDAVRVDRSGLARYAFAGIPMAWVVNIPERTVEVYSEPSGPSADPGYRRLDARRRDRPRRDRSRGAGADRGRGVFSSELMGAFPSPLDADGSKDRPDLAELLPAGLGSPRWVGYPGGSPGFHRDSPDAGLISL
jgi:hypothetical protein